MSIEVKLVLVGDTTVGKTSLVKRYVLGTFDEVMQPTLGAAYTSRELQVKGKTVSVQMWDTAGQERYKAMGPMYYHGVNVAFIVYSIDSRSSFESVDEWIHDIQGHSPRNVQLVLIGNKVDNFDHRVITSEEGSAKAESYSALFFEVSAKTGEGVSDLFLFSVSSFCERHGKEVSEEISRVPKENKSHKGCCKS